MNKITSDVSMACYSCEKMALLAVGYKKLFLMLKLAVVLLSLTTFVLPLLFHLK